MDKASLLQACFSLSCLCPTSRFGRQKWEKGKKLKSKFISFKTLTLNLCLTSQFGCCFVIAKYLVELNYQILNQSLEGKKHFWKSKQTGVGYINKFGSAFLLSDYQQFHPLVVEDLSKQDVHSTHPDAAKKPIYFNGKGALDIPIPIALSNFQIIRSLIDAIMESCFQKDKSKRW